MSYERVMDKRFVKVGDLYLPLYLHGSSNCTMFENGREVFERYWSVFFADNATNLLCSKEGMIDFCKELLDNHTANYEYEWYKVGANWVCGDAIYKQIENACKNALSVEEYLAYGNNHISCAIRVYDKEYHSREVNFKYIDTTEELIDWCNSFAEYSVAENESKYCDIRFTSNKPLKVIYPVTKNVIAKYGKQYVYKYDEHSISSCVDKSQALILTADEFNELAKHWTVQAVSANTKTVAKNYFIRVVGGLRGGYCVKKVSSRSLFFAYNTNDAMRFVSEKQAQKYIDEKLKGRFPNCADFEICKS